MNYLNSAVVNDELWSLVELSVQELKVLHAAMCAMVIDVHAPADNLTDSDVAVAEKMYADLDSQINNLRQWVKD